MARSRRTPAVLFDELNWDYATVERLNPDLSTQVIGFNLGKAVLLGDEASNIALAPGDVVTVYSQKDVRVPVARQTRLVSLGGEVDAPGVYQLQPGETLRALLQRAGGFTPQAYVYGLEFSREETRIRQRENLAAAIIRLESLAAVQTARDAANRRDDTNAQSAAAVSNAPPGPADAPVAVQPNGGSRSSSRPTWSRSRRWPSCRSSTVTGSSCRRDRARHRGRSGGQQQRFIWKPGRTAGDYLKLAGADEAADTSNMFILRADGTVNTRTTSAASSVQTLAPADAAGRRPDRAQPARLRDLGRAFVRNLKDWSQIFAHSVRHRRRQFDQEQPLMLSADSTNPLDAAQAVAFAGEDGPPSVGLADVATWLGEKKLLIGGVTLAAAVVSLIVALLLPPVYTARTTLLAPGSQQQSGSAAALAALGALGGLAPSGLIGKSPD